MLGCHGNEPDFLDTKSTRLDARGGRDDVSLSAVVVSHEREEMDWLTLVSA